MLSCFINLYRRPFRCMATIKRNRRVLGTERFFRKLSSRGKTHSRIGRWRGCGWLRGRSREIFIEFCNFFSAFQKTANLMIVIKKRAKQRIATNTMAKRSAHSPCWNYCCLPLELFEIETLFGYVYAHDFVVPFFVFLEHGFELF